MWIIAVPLVFFAYLIWYQTGDRKFDREWRARGEREAKNDWMCTECTDRFYSQVGLAAGNIPTAPGFMVMLCTPRAKCGLCGKTHMGYAVPFGDTNTFGKHVWEAWTDWPKVLPRVKGAFGAPAFWGDAVAQRPKADG